MTRKQAFYHFLVLLAACSLGAGAFAAPTGAAPAPSQSLVSGSQELLSGLVHDGVGGAMDRALVLLTPLGGGGSVRTALTDAGGRYRFDDVAAGTYRVTAIRDGYEASVGSISTWIGRKLDLVLVPSGDANLVAPRADWILSAPARDILRDTDAVSQLPAPRGPAAASSVGDHERAMMRASEILESVDGEIRQSYTQADAQSAGPERVPSGGSGNATSLLLGSPIGERIRWDFLGERRKENMSGREAGVEARLASAERMRVNIKYDTGATGQFDVRAYYDHDALDFQSLGGVDPGWTSRDRRGWGYDAGWASPVDDDSSIQVEMKYLGSAVGGARGSKAGRDDAQYSDEADADANIWRTAARYSKSIGSNHGVHIGLKARYYSFGGQGETRVAPTPQQDPSLFEEYGRNGWTVNVSAADSWRMLDPVAFDFGVDVSRSAYSAGSMRQAMVPQAGVTLTPGPSTTIRGAVSYVAIERELAGTGIDDSNVRDQDRALGYRMRVERRLGNRFLLILDAESRPCLYDSIGASWDSPGTEDSSRTLYISDPGSSVREGHVGFEARPSEGILLAFGAAAGRVDGRVGASIPDQDLLRSLPDGRVRYGVAHVDGRFDRTRTGVRVELTRLEQMSIDTSADPYGDRRILVQLLQGLGFFHPGNTDWSLVLAYASFRPEGDTSAPGEPDPALHASMQRISGGVSVRF